MSKKVLVVLAAGLASRFGSLKQVRAVNAYNEVLLDYSVYDALRAGFSAVVFIIKAEMRAAFEAAIGSHLRPYIEVRYAFQDFNDLPQAVTLDPARVKPLGTAHALYCARNSVKPDEKIVVINADDYYGPQAFQTLADYFDGNEQPQKRNGVALKQYAMVAYELDKTLSEMGFVSRGVCELTPDSYLERINERTQIGYLPPTAEIVDGERVDCDADSCSLQAVLLKEKQARERVIAYSEDGGASWRTISGKTPVSMNIWAFDYSIFALCQDYLSDFLQNKLAAAPLKAECYLPLAVGEAVKREEVQVKVYQGNNQWFGLTYQDDYPKVQAAICKLVAEELYPQQLWPPKN